MDEEYLQTCIDAGMEVNEIDVEAFREASQPVWTIMNPNTAPSWWIWSAAHRLLNIQPKLQQI